MDHQFLLQALEMIASEKYDSKLLIEMLINYIEKHQKKSQETKDQLASLIEKL